MADIGAQLRQQAGLLPMTFRKHVCQLSTYRDGLSLA